MLCALTNPVPDDRTDLGLISPVIVDAKTNLVWSEVTSALVN